MRVLIATPLYPPDIGGPATYVRGLEIAMKEEGITVEVATFKEFLRYPSGIRHFLFFIHIFKKMRHVDSVIVLDTVSVAIPTVLASFVRGKKLVIRIGGDFVWERFIERTKKKILLSQFYASNQPLNVKEKMLIWLQRYFVFAFADKIIFSTEWQRDIWKVPYRLHVEKIRVIENAYASDESYTRSDRNSDSKAVVWIGRNIILKNVDVLDRVMVNVQKEFPNLLYKKYTNIDHEEVLRVLGGARVLVLPSVSDVSPNLALEAIACGVPVLLTHDCGLKEVLQDSVIWIDPLDEGDVYKHIVTLLDDTEYLHAKEKVQAFTSTRTYTDVVHEFVNILSI